MATPDNAISSAATIRRSRGIKRGASDGRRDAIDIEIKRRDRMTRRANKYDKYFIVLSAYCYRARERTIVPASGNPRTMSPRKVEGAMTSKIESRDAFDQKNKLNSTLIVAREDIVNAPNDKIALVNAKRPTKLFCSKYNCEMQLNWIPVQRTPNSTLWADPKWWKYYFPTANDSLNRNEITTML